ncbi:unnamed protein product [Oppiella nova]|uniref:EGF-like domain-containing protein n=1 Tax=Oppiella nova TaxID=334625 RepID=A0A7R9QMQ3_9ACAR|nr:unnamed protein product [Oppiella nova]CAG2168083.1 unnamed protein product [Oppiella nova]
MGLTETACNPKGPKQTCRLINDKDGKQYQCTCPVGYTRKPNDHPTVCLSTKWEIFQGKPVCKCEPPYVRNDKTYLCELGAICGKGGTGRQECEKQNAYCLLESGGYNCKACPIGTFPDQSTPQKCVPGCQQNYRDENCQEINAVCNPSMNPNDAAKQLLSDFCICKPGFLMNTKNQRCIATKMAWTFNLKVLDKFTSGDLNKRTVINLVPKEMQLLSQIDFPKYDNEYMDYDGYFKDFYSSNELNTAIENTYYVDAVNAELRREIENLVKTMLAGQDKRMVIDTLTLNMVNKTGDYYDCTFSVQGTKDTKDMKAIGNDIFKEFCHSFQQAKDCFVAVTSAPAPNEPDIKTLNTIK